jgi:hypothetical protein
VNPVLAPDLDRIVLKALKKNPEERFASAKEFRAALSGVGAITVEPPAVVDRPHHVSPQLFVQQDTQKPPLAPLMFGFLALATGLVILSWAAMH